MHSSISIQKTNQLKSIAILMMLFIHLFNTHDYEGLFIPLIFLGDLPLSYYVSLFCDAALPIFAFVSGYGLYYSYTNDLPKYSKKNIDRTKKLYVRYWIILIMFAVIIGLILGKPGFPGDWQKLLLNLTALQASYSGAWWFFTIYIFFVFTSKFWFRILNTSNPYFFLGLLTIGYIISFYLRIYQSNIFNSHFFNWLYNNSNLYFCTLFQFMLGSFALKYHWHDKVTKVFKIFKHPNLIVVIGIVALIIFHGLVPNSIVAPITGTGFIFLFLQMTLVKKVESSLDFFTPHATNLWLVHMFIYLTYFRDIIYAPKYVILIFVWLVLWCLVASFLVNVIYNKVNTYLK